MTETLWTIDDYRARAGHADHRVRAWALGRLAEQHPLSALDLAVERLGDEEVGVRVEAFHLLSRWGGPDLAPGVLAGLEGARSDELHYRASLLADWGCQEAAELLVDRLNRGAADFHEHAGLTRSLAVLAPEVLRTWIRAVLDAVDPHGAVAADLVHALEQCHHPADIGWLVDRRLRAGDGHPLCQPIERALQRSIGPDWLAGRLADVLDQGPAEVAATIAESEGSSPPRLFHRLDEILRAVQSGMAGWPVVLLELVRGLVEERGLAVEAWSGSGERLEGYRWQVTATLSLLEHLVRVSASASAPTPEQRLFLASLALAGVVGIDVDRDDLAWLDQRGDDRRAALLELLASPRARIPVQIEEPLAGLGPSILPELLDALGDLGHYWSAARAARTLETLAAHHPAECLPAVEAMLDAVGADDGDYIGPPLLGALRLLGPAAAPAVLARLARDGDEFGSLLSVLRCYPTLPVARGLHDPSPGGSVEVFDLCDAHRAVAWEGSLDRLAGGAAERGAVWARLLLDLCAILEVDHPLRERWEQVVEAARAEQRARQEWWSGLLGGRARPDGGSARSRRTAVKRAKRRKARTQRKKQRKATKKKKRKRRK